VEHARRSALAVAAAVVLAALLTGAWVMSSRPQAAVVPSGGSGRSTGRASPGPAPPSSDGTASVSVPAGGASAAVIVVDVAGKVRRPGLYRLAPGARVDDAVRAAGGMTSGVNAVSVNLAARITDGEQIVVGAPAGAPVAGAGTATSSAAAPIDLNAASVGQLQELPGVGPVLAQHIVDWRVAHGSFASVEQLRSVSGIGPAKFAAIRPMVVV
jgi:competence protein ComEA